MLLHGSVDVKGTLQIPNRYSWTPSYRCAPLMRCVWIRFVIRTFVYQSPAWWICTSLRLRRDSQTLARYSVKVRFLFYNAVDREGRASGHGYWIGYLHRMNNALRMSWHMRIATVHRPSVYGEHWCYRWARIPIDLQHVHIVAKMSSIPVHLL
jgi:hypothetical protein